MAELGAFRELAMIGGKLVARDWAPAGGPLEPTLPPVDITRDQMLLTTEAALTSIAVSLKRMADWVTAPQACGTTPGCCGPWKDKE